MKKFIRSMATVILTIGFAVMLMPVKAFAAPPPDSPPAPEPQPTVEEPSGPYYQKLLDEIETTESGIIEYEVGDGLSPEVLRTLALHPDAFLVYTYTLEDGTKGTVIIPGETAGLYITDETEWCGHLWLEKYYGMPKAETYVIQPGDTLSGIANKFGTTVDAIMADNSFITSPNKIQANGKLSISLKNEVSLGGSLSLKNEKNPKNNMSEGVSLTLESPDGRFIIKK